MRNTRQAQGQPEQEGIQGSSQHDAPILQQILETMRALQESNEQFRREREDQVRERTEAREELEKIREEARVEQERLWEEVRLEQERTWEEARAEQERVREEARADRERIQAELMARIEASQAAQEQLRRDNEELRRSLLQGDRQGPRRAASDPQGGRPNPRPFSQAIMDEAVPRHYITPKVTSFTGSEDPDNHLTAFNAQMIISGGTDAVQCKMFMGTLTGMALKWFSTLPDGHITSFAQFSTLFGEQFAANKVKPPRMYDLFGVRQREGETLKAYLTRFGALAIQLQTRDEEMTVAAFEQGLRAGPFSDCLIRNPAATLAEVRERAVAHIQAEETVYRKNNSLRVRQTKQKELGTRE